jgi:type I restriction enzyme, S subunit
VTTRLATLGDICELRYGKSLPALLREDGEVSVYGSNGRVGTHTEPLLEGPAIVVGRKGSFGEVHFCQGPLWPIDTTYFIDRSSTECDLSWLRYLLQVLPLKALNKSAAIPGLNREDACRLPVLVPTLDEQRRIAAVLDKADGLRRKRRRSLDLHDDLTKSIFLEIFGNPESNPKGWKGGRISDLLDETQYGTSEKAGDEGRYPILRMGNITSDGRTDFKDLKYIDLDDKDLDKFTLRRGDILFNRTNSAELVGKTAVFDRDEPFAFAGYLVRARARKGVSPHYISGYLNSKHGKATLRGMAKSIVGMANINAKEMQTIPILIPDAKSQEAFSKALSSIEASRLECHRHLKSLNALFSSLQSRAFSGQL